MSRSDTDIQRLQNADQWWQWHPPNPSQTPFFKTTAVLGMLISRQKRIREELNLTDCSAPFHEQNTTGKICIHYPDRLLSKEKRKHFSAWPMRKFGL